MTISPEAALAICEHMNDDHADSIAHYATAFAKLQGVRSATMTGIDATAMELEVTLETETVKARIAFDHVLVDATDARETLISMARSASAHGRNGG